MLKESPTHEEFVRSMTGQIDLLRRLAGELERATRTSWKGPEPTPSHESPPTSESTPS